jgi:hypothetical protein
MLPARIRNFPAGAEHQFHFNFIPDRNTIDAQERNLGLQFAGLCHGILVDGDNSETPVLIKTNRFHIIVRRDKPESKAPSFKGFCTNRIEQSRPYAPALQCCVESDNLERGSIDAVSDQPVPDSFALRDKAGEFIGVMDRSTSDDDRRSPSPADEVADPLAIIVPDTANMKLSLHKDVHK